MKRVFKFIGLVVSGLIAISVALVCWAYPQYTVPILMYHKIDRIPGDLNAISPESFSRQLDYLKNNNYQIISLKEFVDAQKHGRKLARKSVVITFDDGLEDNYHNAFPILRQHEFPATVFIITDSVGLPGFMNWEQLKEMDAAGFKVESHTRRHPYLPDFRYDPAKLFDEIAGSKNILEENLGREIHFFSYPSGGYSSEVKDVVKSAGYKAACSTNRGQDKRNQDLFALNRIRVKGKDHGLFLWAKTSGYYQLFRKPRSPY